MKRITILAIVGCMMFVLLAANLFAADDAGFKVTTKSDKVFVKLYPSKEWSELSLGQTVHSKDVIRTDICDVLAKGKEAKYIDTYGNVCPICSAATLELPDKSSLSLKADSEVSIDDLALNNSSRKVNINMSKGELRMIITKTNMPSDFNINTPYANYHATGTIFYVKTTSNDTKAYVADGSINALNPKNGKRYTVPSGSEMDFKNDGTASGPVPVSEVALHSWNACYNVPIVEPYEPPDRNNPVNPPHHTPERPVSGA